MGFGASERTVLLSRFSRMAEERDWIIAQVEAKSQKSMRDMVGEAGAGAAR